MIDLKDVLKLIDNCDDISKDGTSFYPHTYYGLQFVFKDSFVSEYTLIERNAGTIAITDNNTNVGIFKSSSFNEKNDINNKLTEKIKELTKEVNESKEVATKSRLDKFLKTK